MTIGPPTPPTPERHVAPSARVFTGCCAALAAWQIGWIADQAERIDLILPAPWSVTFWLTAWSVVLATSAVATATGRDLQTRVALAVVAVVSGMGIVTAIMDGAPMGHQFWQVGQACVLVGTSFGLLVAPLRTIPRHTR